MKYNKLTALILTTLLLFQILPVTDASADDFVYPNATLEMLQQEVLKEEMTKAIDNGHPYLFATSDGIVKIKEYAFGKDANLTEMYSYVKSRADELLSSDIIRLDNFISANTSYLSHADSIMNRTMILCLAYLVEEDERYAAKAYSQAEYLCSLNTWGEVAMIDNVRLLFSVSICYDWLYDWLGTERQAFLASSVRTLCLSRVSYVYNHPDEDYWAFDSWLLSPSGNHCVQDSSTIFLSSMAFADSGIDFMTDIMTHSAKKLLSGITGLYPDGIWFEGPSYWRFVGPFAARFMQGKRLTLGT